MRIVLLGLPGAGKGTQAALLASSAGVPHVATGNIFRQAMTAGTPLGLQVREIVERGGLVPDQLTVAIVRQRLMEADAARGFVLDGFPRTVPQALALDAMLRGMAAPLERAVLLQMTADEAVARLAGRRVCPRCGATYHLQAAPPAPDGTCPRCGAAVEQRADDREEVQRRRVEAYEGETAPLVPHYEAAGRLLRVPAGGDVADVAARLRAALAGAAR